MSLQENLALILDLQKQYNSRPSDEMRKRNQLVTRDVPQALSRALNGAAFPIPQARLHVNGGAQAGLNAKVPWIQISDSNHSTSPQDGWYLVLLFAQDGSGFYASVNKNSTSSPTEKWDAQPLSDLEMEHDRRWALDLLEDEIETCDLSLTKRINLKTTSNIAKAYEKTHIVGVHYLRESLPAEDELVADLVALGGFLTSIYTGLSNGDEPLQSAMHLLLKWNRGPAHSVDELDLHREVADREGSVSWGCFTTSDRSIGAARLQRLESQIDGGTPTEAILYETGRGGVEPNIWRARVQGVATDEAELSSHQPGHYDGSGCFLFLQLAEFSEMPASGLDDYRLESTGAVISEDSLTNQTSPLYIMSVQGEASPVVVEDQVGLAAWDELDATGVRTMVARPRAWIVRAGKDGGNEAFCLANGVAVIGWDELPKPPEPVTVDWLRTAIADGWPEQTPAGRANFLGQLRPFMTEIETGDLIAIPLKTNRGAVALGICTRPYYYDDGETDPSQQKQIGVDWKITDFDLSALGTQINKYLNQPRTVAYLDDDTAERLFAVIEHGSPHLYWWVNQGTSWKAEQRHGCICAPRQAQNGNKLRHHLDVGRVQTGDVIVHYADGEIWTVSEAMSDGHESIRPYEMGADRWQREVFLARCWYDGLATTIPLADLNGRVSDGGPFNSGGGVKQGYLWPLAHSFVGQLRADSEDELRGTTLNPGNVWLLQANPAIDKSWFPDELKQHNESNTENGLETTFDIRTHHRQMRVGDRVLFWLSGEQAGIYATGWITKDPYKDEGQEEDRWSVDVYVWWNTYNDPFLKAELLDNPVLRELRVINFPRATSFDVTPEQWAEFKRLAIDRETTIQSGGKTMESETSAQLAKRLYLEPESELEEIIALLDDRSQAIFYGPPGTGKTWVARELAKWLAGSEDRVDLVQFHPSYSYEDFIEGWRPTEDGKFELKAGPLKRLAKRAADDPDHQTFVLVIDEINRANLSKVLGELFFLFEYRRDEVTLQYSEEKFSLPDNLKIIGTMNTADRSIALVDAALRRRFHFHPFFPDRPPIKGLLKRWLGEHRPELTSVADLVDRANGLLEDRNMAIGPSHFMKKDLTDEKVQQIWRRTVIPFIEDQFFDEPVRVKQFTYEALTRVDNTEPDNEDADPSAD